MARVSTRHFIRDLAAQRRVLVLGGLAFLQKKIERQYEGTLISCSLDECRPLLDRFATPDIAYFAAAKAKNRDVCAFGKHLLNEMARDGDPYALEFEEKLRAHERGLTLERR